MPSDAKPREPENPAHGQGNETSAPAPSGEARTHVAWPRDMNSPATSELPWGRDPEDLRDA